MGGAPSCTVAVGSSSELGSVIIRRLVRREKSSSGEDSSKTRIGSGSGLRGTNSGITSCTTGSDTITGGGGSAGMIPLILQAQGNPRWVGV